MTEPAPSTDTPATPSARETITAPAEGGDTPSFSVPEQYAEKIWAQNVKSVDDLYSQLDGAQSLIGKKTVPTSDDPPEKWEEFYNQLRPETHEGYELNLPEEMKDMEGQVDMEAQGQYKELFHKLGLTAKQAQGIFEGHLGLEMAKMGEMPTQEQMDTEFDSMMEKAHGSKSDEALKVAKIHISSLDEETKQSFAQLPNEQMVAVVGILNKMHSKYSVEDSAPAGGGDVAPAKSIDEKVVEANKLRMSAEIKDPFHEDNMSKRAQLKQLDEEIQRALSR